MKRWFASVIAIASMIGLSACGSTGASTGKGTPLVGLFTFTPGAVQGAKVSGTYFRMVQIGGTTAAGPYMVNGDSKADGGRATLLRPGTSGGLRTGAYQAQPHPAFAAHGNSLAQAITRPTKFFGVDFSISTNAVDPQTNQPVAAPTVLNDNGHLTADLSSWAASWNNQNFNQGAPKPVSNTGAKAPGQANATKVWDWVSGTYLSAPAPAGTTGSNASGTYDPSTGDFTLEWSSLIVGGPFNRFVGLWHLEGRFVPASAAPAGG